MDKIVIRVDSNSFIGNERIIRCIAIAQAIQELYKKIEIIFIVSDEISAEIPKKFGFSATILNSIWNEKERELDVLIPYLLEAKIQFILVDRSEERRVGKECDSTLRSCLSPCH